MTTVLPFPPLAVLDPRANRDEAVRCIVARLLSEVDAREEKEFGGYAVGAVSAHDIWLEAAAHLSGLCFWIRSAGTEVLEGFTRAGCGGEYRGGTLHIVKWIRGSWEKQIFVRFQSSHILPSHFSKKVCYENERSGERT